MRVEENRVGPRIGLRTKLGDAVGLIK